MENIGTTADPSIDAVDVAIIGTIADTTPMASMTTTAAITNPKPKAKVKKEVTTAEREVQNQKR
jgi:hypothetical protein